MTLWERLVIGYLIAGLFAWPFVEVLVGLAYRNIAYWRKAIPTAICFFIFNNLWVFITASLRQGPELTSRFLLDMKIWQIAIVIALSLIMGLFLPRVISKMLVWKQQEEQEEADN